MDRMTGATNVPWINPTFAQWGRAQANWMTQWLYQDRSYPEWNNPNNWPNAGLVRIVQRTITFGPLGVGGIGTGVMDFFGGRNYILLARTVAATTSVAPVASVETDLILYQEVTKAGTKIVEEQAVSMIAGTGELPFVLPIPDFVLGNERRDVTVTNNTGIASVTVRVGWTVAFLDTGR